MTEHGEPRRHTARELLAMAEAARRAAAERTVGPAPASSPPPTPARAVLASTDGVPAAEPHAAPAAAVLLEQLEAEVQVPAGIASDDPLAPRTDLFMPPAVTGRSVRPDRATRGGGGARRGRGSGRGGSARCRARTRGRGGCARAEPEPEAAAAAPDAEPEPEAAAAAVAAAAHEPAAGVEGEPAPDGELEAEPPIVAAAATETEPGAVNRVAEPELVEAGAAASEEPAAADLEPEPAVAAATMPGVEPEAERELAAAVEVAPAWATEEAEAERGRPPHRPDEGPERRRPYVPPRSRRELEERLRAEEEWRRSADPPAWTARARRRDAELSGQDDPEQLSLAAREQQHRLELEAEHRRRMRSRPPSRRPHDVAYDVSSEPVGEGSSLEIEDVSEAGGDSGQQVWAGQGKDDRAGD